MRNKILRVLPLVLGLLFLCSVPMAGAEEKIGFVDVREIMVNSDAGKKASEEFKKTFEKNKTQIQAKETELKKLREELEKQRSILKEAALKEKESAYQKKFHDYQVMVKNANDDMQKRDQELSRSMIPEIMKVISTIAAKEKYTAVFDIGTALFFVKEKDLTKQVLAEFDRTYKPKK
ncbi:MAG: Outer membrane p25 precursor [Syntrophus sp. PtaB.Bin075]|nr:MAG: Outer membrane p25 precursor [Syntrophus sp. PtaB.Bin075]